VTWQERRYPLSSLVEASGLTEAAFGRSVGLSGSTLKKARTSGLTESAADRYATRAGLHPFEVWEDWGLEPCPECGTPFAPLRKGHTYCTTRCTKRVWARDRYRNDPDHRARKLAQVKAHDDEVRRAKNLKAARRRAEHRERLRAEHRAYYAANAERLRAEERARYHARKEAA
jgi:uncharacterized Zn finger protein (UPF0148 family)